MEAKFVAGKFMPPDEIGLTSSHKTFAVFVSIGNMRDI